MFAKKNIIAIVTIMLSIFTLFLSSCALFGGKIADESPKEEVVSIEKITVDLTNGGEETIVELSEDKWDLFMDVLNELKYIKFYNIAGVKCMPFDEICYVITYETCTIRLNKHQFSVYKAGELQKSIRFKSINPSDRYDELSAFFDE